MNRILMSAGYPTRKWIFASLFTAILGLIDTAVLIAQHYRIADEGLMQKSFCTLSSFIDCDTALSSSYAHIMNIPVAEIGFLFYAVVAILSVWALGSEKRRASILAFLFIFSIFATGYGIYMTFVLLAKLEVICLFCSISHVLTLLIFIFLWIATGAEIKPLFTPPSTIIPYIISTVVISGIGLLFFFGANERAHSGPPVFDEKALLRHFFAQEPKDLNITNRPSKGPADAPITIVDFSDFQCPFCKRAAYSLQPYLGKYRNDVRIVYINFPLDKSCNPAIQRVLHPAACLAAKASLCAFEKKGNEGFWKYHDLIFENQKRLSHGLLTETLAPQIGMTAQEMGTCMASADTEVMLSEDVELGNTTGIQGTPAIYINGRFLRGWVQPTLLRAVVAAELKRVKDESAASASPPVE